MDVDGSGDDERCLLREEENVSSNWVLFVRSSCLESCLKEYVAMSGRGKSDG
jgi:hypothetical protein